MFVKKTTRFHLNDTNSKQKHHVVSTWCGRYVSWCWRQLYFSGKHRARRRCKDYIKGNTSCSSSFDLTPINKRNFWASYYDIIIICSLQFTSSFEQRQFNLFLKLSNDIQLKLLVNLHLQNPVDAIATHGSVGSLVWSTQKNSSHPKQKNELRFLRWPRNICFSIISQESLVWFEENLNQIKTKKHS